jgi:hypothetical protein
MCCNMFADPHLVSERAQYTHCLPHHHALLYLHNQMCNLCQQNSVSRCISVYSSAVLLERLGVHGSVHHSINLIEITNKMQLCIRIYYFIVY